ncbi:type I polyketide synthase [Cryptosporangium japonicum]|uniref:Acyl transferase domain-containing protein n=1 Tax=Cryptosporangium japonicum TaxID=80872 RepID=A0ABP3D5A8_9ACTN
MASEAELREYLRWVTADLHRARQRLAERESRDREPIAIVGMACRYPGGASTPEALWDLLHGGRSAVGPLPTDRGWEIDRLYHPDPDHRGTFYAREGGFLSDAADFDAAFFDISPREALVMDPQQRLLMEVSWEAFERAGLDPTAQRGSDTGVFFGVSGRDYGSHLDEPPEEAEGYLLTGFATSVASGRVAYSFGLEGPAVTLDTACSSSLVAIHLAAQALRLGECSMALAGGAVVMSTTDVFVEFSRQRGLASDGRCKSFASAADGTGWGEGAGVVLLERLSDARRLGHPVLAVVRGSAINQDGASNGLTAPSRPAQEAVIRRALDHAGLSAHQVDAVEGHGTGTTLGDPIEVQALQATYGRARPPGRPLRLGSIKSNLGHTQAAAGVAGVIKMVLALRHGLLPRTLHVDAPSHHIDWPAGGVELLTDARPWPAGAEPRRAAVSAFGMSGTNAHLILEEDVPEPVAPPQPENGALGPLTRVPWVLSARSGASLRAQAARLRDALDAEPDAEPVATAVALATTRARHEHRAVLLAADHHARRAALDALADGTASPDVVSAEVVAGSGPVFVFPGQGSQWAGMARGLLTVPAFAASIQESDAALAPYVDWSLSALLRGEPDTPSLDRVDVVQPALYAVMVALAETWRAAGVEPAAVIGHSQGEIAAARVAGALSAEDGARLVALRSRVLRRLSGRGGMVSVATSEATVRATLPAELSIAAVNGPRSVVVAGDATVLDAWLTRSVAEGVRARRVPVDYASHTAQMDELHAELTTVLAGVNPVRSAVPFLSAVTGGVLDTAALDTAYWIRNLREPVLFAAAVDAAVAQGFTRFVETSPHPVLLPSIQETAEDAGRSIAVVGSLRRDEDDRARLLTSFAEADAAGVDVRWTSLVGVGTGPVLPLPTYPFDRRRYWLSAPEPTGTTPAATDEAEAAFWSAVERNAADELADLVGDAAPDAPDVWRGVLPGLADWRTRRRERTAVASWRYRIHWRPVDVPTATTTARWLVVLPPEPDDPLGASVIPALEQLGHTVVPLRLDDPTVDRATLAALLRDAAGRDEPATGVLSLVGANERPVPGRPAVASGVAATLTLAQALTDVDLRIPLWCATGGAVSIGRSDPLRSPAQAQIWGLGRVVGLEHPELWGGLVDLPSAPDERAWQRLGAVLAGTGGEDQVAIRASGVFARRLLPAPAETGEPAHPWTPRGCVLVTGGTGALGGHVARWLADAGAEHLVLTSRRGAASPGAAELTAELEALGARVTNAACDVADRDALARLLADVPPVTAVVHAAGVGQATPLVDSGIEELTAVLTGKVAGARNLDALLGDRPLDAFVLFSSGAAVWGSAAQTGYAAANAYLDALAEDRRARGLTATSVAWGSWAGGGMVDDVADDLLRRRGVRPMDPRSAVLALREAVGRDETAVVVADIDWARFVPPFTLARRRPLIEDIPAVRVAAAADRSAEPPHADRTPLLDRLAGFTARERVGALVELVRAEAAAVLGHDSPAAITASRAFRDVGFDSLTAVELRNRLARATGLSLPTTLVFDQPAPDRLARYLLDRLRPGDDAVTPVVAAPSRDVADDPIVIVGMACRYPGGVASPDDLWRLVRDEVDAIGDFPTDRGWDLDGLYDPDPDHPGTSYVRQGGFLADAAGFDADFFGINPREALAMDPQQRLLLETTWEALERAGVDPASVRGSRTGVFAGVAGGDYADGLGTVPEELEAYLGTGSAASVASGRVAYALGLEGPAVTVDTACSSALVALHLAAQALRRDECSLAVASGVAVLSTPRAFVEFSRQRGLAPDARCKPFAAAADGTIWGEGIGTLVLERLSDARRNGHPVRAVLRGSAINQDGASNGLTAPNGPSQERVLAAALADAGLRATDVDAVEAHGTGTTLGDPIEAQALLAAYGRNRDAGPLWLGSVKSNLGHTAAASGMAGVIKMVLALRHGTLPRTLHVDAPTPHVDWSAGDVRLLTATTPWPPTDRPRRAGVSAFGISGTNAHVILEQPGHQPEAEPPAPTGEPVPWILSGASEGALRAAAEELASSVTARPDVDPVTVGRALATTRAALAHRAVLVASTPSEFAGGLRALAEGRPAGGLVVDRTTGGKLAVLFPGQGGQRPGMGRELYARHPRFADAFDAVCAEFDPQLDVPLRSLVFDSGSDASTLARTDYAQAAVFAVEVALYRLVEEFGVRADILCGHSVGEIAAAHVAGVLSLADACRLVAARGRLMRTLPDGGTMIAVEADEDTVRSWLIGRDHDVSIAAVNGPASVVLSGADEAVRAAADHVRELGGRTTRLRVGHAFHSVLMDPILDPFHAVASTVTYRAPEIPVASTLTGAIAVGDDLRTPEYWVRHLREPVRFRDAVRTMRAHGADAWFEVGPEPVLSPAVRDCADQEPGTEPPLLAAALRAGRPEVDTLTDALARLHARGTGPDWSRYFDARPTAAVELPTYPFQRQRYWLRRAEPTPDVAAAGLRPTGHPLLGAAIDDPAADGHVFAGRLTHRTHPWLADHAVVGVVLLPGTAFAELLLAAGREVGCPTLEELTLLTALVVPDEGDVRLRTVVGEADANGRRVATVYARTGAAAESSGWTRHASGVLAPAERRAARPTHSVWPPVGSRPVPLEHHYDDAERGGFRYGEAFQGLRAAWRDDDGVYARIELPAALDGDAGAYRVHPALLDAALHPVGLGPFLADDGRPQLPFSWSGAVLGDGAGARTLRVRIRAVGADAVSLDATDEQGRLVIAVDSVTLRPLPDDALRGARNSDLYRVDWAERTGPTGTPAATGPAPDVVSRDFGPPAASDGGEPGAVEEAVLAALTAARNWLADPSVVDSRLVVVTTGAVATGEAPPEPVGAAVRAFFRSAQRENPDRFLLVDLDDRPASRSALPALVADLTATGPTEPDVAIRDGRLLVPRLVPLPVPTAAAADGAGARSDWPGGGTVVVTGATGLLGGLVARHLVTAHGVRHLTLVSRRGPDAPAAAGLREDLVAAGAEVDFRAGDVGDRDALSDLLADIRRRRPLTAVVHTAGVVDDGLVTTLTAERVRAVLHPKVRAGAYLDELTRDDDLRAFVVFSSLSSVAGGAGQAGYAAANAYLEALVARRRATGRSAVALAWGPWAPVDGAGMTGGLTAVDTLRMRRGGLVPLTRDDGLAIFDRALTAPTEPVLVTARFDLAALKRKPAGDVPALLRALVPAPKPGGAPGGRRPAAKGWDGALAGLEPERRAVVLLDLVRAEVAAVLGHASVERIRPDKPFKDLGFDSLTAVELRNQLTTATGVRLPATLVFDHPSPGALSTYLLGELTEKRDGDGGSVDWDAIEGRLLVAADGGARARAAVVGRLRGLLSRIETRGAESSGPDTPLDADELLSLIDQEFGAR